MPNKVEEEPIVIDESVDMSKPLDEEKIYAGKNIQLTKYHYQDSKGAEHYSEGIHHLRQSNGNRRISVDNSESICTIPFLRRHILCDCIVLVKQYRAPLRSCTLEFPSKFLDGISNVEATAKKEVEDDTGYKATVVKHVSPQTAIDPDVTDGTIKLVSLFIDGDDPIMNANRMAHKNPGDVEVLEVPINGLLDRLNEYSRQGLVVDSRVYAFAIGLKQGEKLMMVQNGAAPETPI